MSVLRVIRNPWGNNPRDKVAKISGIGHLVRLKRIPERKLLSLRKKKKQLCISLVKLCAEPLQRFDYPGLMFSRVDRAGLCGKFKRTRRRGERRLTEKVDK
ncbi:hypothetical protein NPIL_187191 [Nephila pilipes]|uniref:Uncharacterized protein n=1 Tax=Nephila pilipes TaxID=299642 RepID=A0A8X6PC24_NEPPI|nr:hypothetical protein NPIL_187191 [Nephila pilipes]